MRPSATENVTPSSATMPPKRIPTPVMSKSGSDPPAALALRGTSVMPLDAPWRLPPPQRPSVFDLCASWTVPDNRPGRSRGDGVIRVDENVTRRLFARQRRARRLCLTGRCRWRRSVRHKHRNGHRAENAAGDTTEHELAQARVTVAAHDNEIGAHVGGTGQDDIGDI